MLCPDGLDALDPLSGGTTSRETTSRSGGDTAWAGLRNQAHRRRIFLSGKQQGQKRHSDQGQHTAQYPRTRRPHSTSRESLKPEPAGMT